MLPPISDMWSSLLVNVSELGPAQYLALVIAASVLCQWFAWQLGIPSLLVLLLLGFGLGQVVSAQDVFGRDVLFGGVTLAVGLILFEGSLSLRLRQVRDLGRPVLRLCTVTTMIAWPLITVAAWALGFAIEVALLVGAILIVTGPTVINPILRTLRPTKRVSSLLRWEGIVVDPIGAVLAVLVFQGVRAGSVGDALPTVVFLLFKTLLLAFGIAIALGAVLTALMRRHAIPDFLHGVTFLAAAISSMVVSNAIQPESGLLTITILGIYLANQPNLHLERVAEFKEHLQVLFVGALFVVLAGRVSPAQIAEIAPRALLFVVVLVVVVRPISIWLGLWGTKVSRRERTLLACMAPRGIVAAAVTSIFALEFTRAAEEMDEQAKAVGGAAGKELATRAETLAGLADQASQMVPLVFIVIVSTVAIYGLGVGRLAERLGLASTSPQGVLFAGVAPWVINAAKQLKELDVPALVVDREYAAMSRARMAGLNTETVNILSEYAVDEMDVSGIGYLIACTHDDETNATAARQFSRVFDRANVYQLRRAEDFDRPGKSKRNAAGHLNARFPFQPALTYEEMAARVESGMRVKRTHLSGEFDLDDFKARYGERVVYMFTHQNGKLTVVREGAELPATDVTLIALVPAIE